MSSSNDMTSAMMVREDKQSSLAAWMEPGSRRAMAEIQAAIVAARLNPRDRDRAREAIREQCADPEFADQAFFSYARGGKDITDLNVRTAEMLAQHWGNIRWGHWELAREGNFSKLECFAWDTESNAYAVREIQVKHVRDTKGGAVPLRDERDIRENNASQAQRVTRSLLFNVIPGSIVKMARKRLQETLDKKDAEIPLSVRATRAADWFRDEHGVSVARLLARFGKTKLEELTPRDIVTLRQIGHALDQGEYEIDQAFPAEPKAGGTSRKMTEARTLDDVVEAAAEPTAPAKAKGAEPSKEEQERIRQREIAEAATGDLQGDLADEPSGHNEVYAPAGRSKESLAREKAALAASREKPAPGKLL